MAIKSGARRWVRCIAALSLFAACASEQGGSGAPFSNNANATGADASAGNNSGGSTPGSGSTGTSAAPSDANTAPITPATIVLPKYPYYDNDAIQPDSSVLSEQGGRWCAMHPDDKSNAAFYYGFMPLDTVDKLCAPRQMDWPSIAKLMGNMYLSGYFGGIWFRDNAQSGGGRPAGTGQGPTSESDFKNLATKVRDLIDLSLEGTDQDVMDHNLTAVDPPAKVPLANISLSDPLGDMIGVYAYNKGYAESVLANAPQSVKDVPPFECKAFFDCKGSDVVLDVFERMRFGVDTLASATPCDAGPLGLGGVDYTKTECRWGRMKNREKEAEGAEGVGKNLWSGGDFSADTYKTLLTINAGYLLVTGAGAIGEMIGWADQKPAYGRCGILLEAAGYIWNQGYFQGLNSDQKGQEMVDGGVIDLGPQISCPGDAPRTLPDASLN